MKLKSQVVYQTAKALTDEDWALVETVANILEPIHEATLAVCAEKNPTMSMMMPFF
jgi:hypothetical protein